MFDFGRQDSRGLKLAYLLTETQEVDDAQDEYYEYLIVLPCKDNNFKPHVATMEHRDTDGRFHTYE